MSDPKQNYRKKYSEACRAAFQDFQLDLSGCRDPETVSLVASLASEGFYSKEIAVKIGKTPKAVQKIFRRYNFPKLHNIAPPKMEERHDWKHGEKLMKGYLYRRTPNHPNGTKHGNYVAVHRLVMEDKMGRYLLPSEVVDHIDGDITNNHPSNLRVFSSNAEHLRETLKGRCPNWTEDGKRRLLESAKRKSLKSKAD